MGNSTSTIRATELANERVYIRTLGERHPLSDSELRKWVWCHQRLTTHSAPPLLSLPVPCYNSTLASLAVWSAIYGDHDPYTKRRSSDKIDSSVSRLKYAQKVMESISVIEKHLFSSQLCNRLVHLALSIPITDPTSKQQRRNSPNLNFPSSSASSEELVAWEEAYYIISLSGSSGDKDRLEDFLEGISESCGRRGSRASLSRLFVLSSNEENKKVANASDIIYTAYCLALAASYLNETNLNMTGKDNEPVQYQNFIPQSNVQNMKAMVDSLVQSAWKQRQDFGSGVSSTSDLCSLPAASVIHSNQNNGNISLSEFITWAETTVPMMASTLPTFLCVLFFFFSPSSSLNDDTSSESRFPVGVTPLWIPSLTTETKSSRSTSARSSFFHPSVSCFDLFALSCTSLSLASGRWHCLFSSEANGLSCNRLMHSIQGYGGPTLILIRSKNSGGVFGAYTFSAWNQESAGFFGNSDCFLFRLGPDPLGVYRPVGTGVGVDIEGFGINYGKLKQVSSQSCNFMYFNPEARSKGFDGLAHGIGFGGNAELPRLFIDEILDGCCAKSEDLTFDNGPLLSGESSTNGNFEVDAIEAWGVGSSQLVEKALLAREGQREESAKKIRNAMRGAKGQFLEDFQSGLAGGKLYQHRDQIRGRDGDCNLDNSEG